MNKIWNIVVILIALITSLAVHAEEPTVEESDDSPAVVEVQHQGQWFREMSNQTGVKYVYIGRVGNQQAYFASMLPMVANSKVDLIEVVSSETSSKGRNAIRRFAERLSDIYPLEIVCQTRDEDDASLVTIYIVAKPDNPDIATDILIYKWSKTFEVALIHLKGEFDLTNALWQYVSYDQIKIPTIHIAGCC